MRALLACALLLALPELAAAARDGPAATPGAVWISDADDERARELIEQLLRDPDPGARPRRARRAEQVLALLAPLLAARPGDAELHRYAGAAWGRVADATPDDGLAMDPIRRAVAELEQARALAPDSAHAIDIASRLGLLYSWLGDLPRALAEYDDAIARDEVLHAPTAGGDDAPATNHANAAETLMGLGRLREAIARYRLAVRFAGDREATRVLASVGLAVALDRDDQPEAARAAIAPALANDRELKTLDQEDVFFMPRGDKLYYQALGAIAAGYDELAQDRLRAFLVALPGSRYRARAEARLAELARAAAAPPGDGFRITVGELHPPGRDGAATRRLVAAREAAWRRCFPRADFRHGGSELDLGLELSTTGRARLLGLVHSPSELTPARRACLAAVAASLRLGRGEAGTLTVPLRLDIE